MSSRRKSTPGRKSRRGSSSSKKTVEEKDEEVVTTTTTVEVEEEDLEQGDSETRMSRVQEKHQLHSLNDRLQNFVLHSKAMDEENADLRRQLEELREQLRQQLCDVREEYARDSKKLRTATTTLLGKNSGLESENVRLQAQVHALQEQLTKTTSLREENHKLEDKVRDYSDEIANLKATIAQRDEEIEHLREIIANHEEVIATRDEQLQEKTSELETVQKTVKKNARHTDSDLAERVRTSLTEANQKWQRETKTQLAKLEVDLRSHFKSTVSELNERCDTLVRQNDRLREENERVTTELDNSAAMQQDLLSKLAEQERAHKHSISQLQRDLSKREAELTNSSKMLFLKDREFNDLMDVKISLQTEIEKYRSILDVEEARINTPDRSKRSRATFEATTQNDDDEVVTTTSSRKTSKRSRTTKSGKKSSRRSSRSSSRKQSGTRITNGKHTGPVRINHVDLVSDCVTVANQTHEPISLKGWTLISETGNQVFEFPETLSLEPGKRVTVWSGAHAESHHNPPEHLFWTRRYVWNNQGDTAILVNPAGEHVSTVTGVPAAMSDASSAANGSPAKESAPRVNPGRGAGAPVMNGGATADGDQNCRIM